MSPTMQPMGLYLHVYSMLSSEYVPSWIAESGKLYVTVLHNLYWQECCPHSKPRFSLSQSNLVAVSQVTKHD